MSKNNKKYYQVPSNREVDEITNNEHYTQEVAKGLITLHKGDVSLKEYVISLVNSLYENWILDSYKVSKIEILIPHLVDYSEDIDHEYVVDTVNAFMRGCGQIPDDMPNEDAYVEAILVQVQFTDYNDGNVCFMKGGLLSLNDNDEQYSFVCPTE